MITKIGAAAWKEFFHGLSPQNQQKLFVNRLCNKVGISPDKYAKLPDEVKEDLAAKIIKDEAIGINTGTKNILARNNGVEIPVAGRMERELSAILNNSGGYLTMRPAELNAFTDWANSIDYKRMVNFLSSLPKNKYVALRHLKAAKGNEIAEFNARINGIPYTSAKKAVPYLDAISRRHEALEVAAAAKHNKPLDINDASEIYNKNTGTAVGRHMDPSVLVGEARLVNNSPILNVEDTQNLRKFTGEADLLNGTGVFKPSVYNTPGSVKRIRNSDYRKALSKIKPSNADILSKKVNIPGVTPDYVVDHPGLQIYLAG